VQKEPATAPRRNSGTLVIREGGARTASPPRRRKATKKDAAHKAAFELTEADARRAEEAATEEAIQRSLRDVVPAENTMPLDAALEWSRRHVDRRLGSAEFVYMSNSAYLCEISLFSSNII
jgi:hypothetical protein